MSQIQTDLWKRLEEKRPQGDRLAARPRALDATGRLLCAVDSLGQRHLLITLGEEDEQLDDTQSRGLAVSTRELSVRGQTTARYLDVECRDPAGHTILDLIGGELAIELAQPNSRPAEVTRRVLAKWRRFWGQVPRSILSREEQLGLFGELWFLQLWLAPHTGWPAAVRRWRGPFRSRHDYEWPGQSVEVKVTTSTRGRIHRINGVEQLLPPEGGDLLFFSLRVREEAGASTSLTDLICRIREALEAAPETLGEFEIALSQAGYSPVHDEEYAKTRLRVVEERLYVVREDFPRIIPPSFGETIPVGIERVEYDINLGGFDHLTVAATPAEAEVNFR